MPTEKEIALTYALVYLGHQGGVLTRRGSDAQRDRWTQKAARTLVAIGRDDVFQFKSIPAFSDRVEAFSKMAGEYEGQRGVTMDHLESHVAENGFGATPLAPRPNSGGGPNG